MSFRSTLFWAIVLTLASMASIERGMRAVASLGAERTREHVEGRLDDAVADLEAHNAEAVRGVDPATGPRRVREPDAVYTPVSGGYDQVGPLPTVDRGPGWANRTVRLQDGAIVSVAVPLSWWERYARDAGRLELVTVPILAIVALWIASWLTKVLTRPLANLNVATERLAEERFVGSVPIPAGDDELARLARNFERTRAAIRVRVERERTFTRFVSHELRTPLSALKLQIERAALPDVDPSEVAPRLERNVRRMEEVLIALLQLAHANEPTETGDSADRAPLRELITDVVSATSGVEGTRLVVSDATPEGTIVRDARLLHQALANLTENAVRHGSTRAALRLWVDGDRLEVRVVDDGPGVDATALARLTEPFFRGPTRSTGLGLGLALVAAIVERLRGELILRNRDGGFEASLRLPGIVIVRER